MAEQSIAIYENEEEDNDNHTKNSSDDDMNNNNEESRRLMAKRKERRKTAKKEKRKQKRKELAELARREEEAQLNDPVVQLQLQIEEEREKERAERERREFEERERMLLEAWERKRAQEAEEERRKALEEEEKSKKYQVGCEDEVDEDGWEYVEEGPPEIIWQGNEIIVKKKKVRVKKNNTDQQIVKEDPNRPTSNPLPPQSETFADYKNEPILSAQQLLENVAQQTPNFGTEQDKAHCPFHLKTGACRFGSSCSRIHFYPDKSCTLLIKNMYNGPGLSWEQDEGLENNFPNQRKCTVLSLREFHSKDVTLYNQWLQIPGMYTDEEIERAYEEFYEDVHTEFLKFGELVNFKVCRNGSSHLRGNVYVHYKSLDSAVLAYHSINGRYFAGKRVQCEYIGVTRWKVAICGEFMKLKLKSCSRGTACNFIHCFRNPGGDYEWADWDRPPPKYWIKKMVALFGNSDESGYHKQIENESPRLHWNSGRMSTIYDRDRYHYQRSQSREIDYSRRISRKYSEEYDIGRSAPRIRHGSADKKRSEILEEKHCKDLSSSRKTPCSKSPFSDYDSDKDRLGRDSGRVGHRDRMRKNSQHRSNGKLEYQGGQSDSMSTEDADVNANLSDLDSDKDSKHGHERKSRSHRKKRSGILDKDGAIDSGRDWLDDNRHTAMCQSDTMRSTRQHHEVFVLPDDRWDDRSRNYENEMESEDAKSKAQKAHKVKHSNCGDKRKSSSYDRNYTYSDSDSNSNSDSSSGLSRSQKRFPNNLKKSKGKQNTDNNYDSSSRVQYPEENESQAYYGEDVDKRGRWESSEGLSFQHDTFKRKSHGKDHIECSKEHSSSDEYGNESKSPHSSKSCKRKH